MKKFEVEGRSRYTSGKGPWEMVYLEKIPDKTSALQREKQLKRVNANYIRWLVEQDTNMVDKLHLLK